MTAFVVLFLAGLLTAGSVAGVWWLASNARSTATIRVIALLSFTVAYPISAVTHLLVKDPAYPGFHSLDASSSQGAAIVGESLLAVAVALASLLVGFGSPTARTAPPLQAEYHLRLRYLGLAFGAIGVIGMWLVYSSNHDLVNDISQVNRGRELPMGMARYYFMARWLSWGLAFIASSLILSKRPGAANHSFVLVSLVAILSFLGCWASGGRTEGLLAGGPILLVTRRLETSTGRAQVLLLVVLVSLYWGAVTLGRGYADDSRGALSSVLDWQAGRFSMVGLSIEMTRNSGFDFGLCIVDGLRPTANLPSTSLGLSPLIAERPDFTGIVGNALRGSTSVTSIVPGTIAEFYYNAGYLGVAFGYMLIGRIAKYCDNLLSGGRTPGTAFAGAYIGLLIATAVVPGTSTRWVYVILTFGLPCVLLVVLDLVFPLRRKHFNSSMRSCCGSHPSLPTASAPSDAPNVDHPSAR